MTSSGTASAPRALRTFIDRLPTISAAVAIVVGAMTLVGWWTAATWLTHPLPGPPTMVANAAVMMILAGTALTLVRRATVARARVARGCAVAVCTIAAATLFQYVVGIDLGIDRLIADGRIGTFPMGRPTPQAAIALALIGAALLVVDRRTARGRLPSDYLALAATAIAGGALLGHLFGVPAMYGAPTMVADVGMSIPMAAVIVAVAAGILAMQAQHGIVALVVADDAGGAAARDMLRGLLAFAPIAVVIVLGARVGWYALPIASALVVLVALAVGSSLVLVTAARLSRKDAVTREALAKLRASEEAQHALAVELAQAYAAERARRAWLNSIIDQLPEGVIIVGADGRLEAVNRAAMAWSHGDDGAGGVRFDTRTTTHAPVPIDELPVLRTLRTREPTMTEEYLLAQPDGRAIPVATRATPVLDGDGALAGAVAVIQDISDRKEAERLREEWTAVVAHDLRGPIATILLTADSLLELERPNDADERAIRRVRRCASRLHRMIDDLLDAARITSNQLAITRETTDLVECVTSAIEAARLAHPDAVIELEAPARHDACIDPDRIDQVVTNLVSNAVKYGTAGAPIRVAVVPFEGACEISVTNEGPGIPADELPRLFTRFSRTRGARASGTTGIGLGLYICKGLVEAHGGEIAVVSDGGRTRFAFVLPPVTAPVQLARVPRASSPVTRDHSPP